MGKEEISISFKSIKKNWTLILLVFIVLFGFYVRLYHLDYPVVGYHNWKETHYLTEARNFERDGFFEYGFFVPAIDYPPLREDPSGAHSDTFPTVSILSAISLKIFGVELWAARIIGVLSIIGVIIFMYLLVKELFNREDIALVAAALTAMNPLTIFFSHNVQLINPGLFFMMAALYYYVVWQKRNEHRKLLICSIFLTFSVLTKYTFAYILILIALTFPYKKIIPLFKKPDKRLTNIILSLSPLIFVPLWFIYSNVIIASKYSAGRGVVEKKLIEIGVIFTGQWWTILKSYSADNYTLIGMFFVILGIIILLLSSSKKFEIRFMKYWLISSIVFIFVMSQKLDGHSYHQYPIMPFIIIMMAYSFIVVSSTIKNSIKVKNSAYLALVILLIMVFIPSMGAKDKQFDTQFYGVDIAGEYIMDNSQTDERIFFSGGQTYGILWHADRKGIGSIVNSSEMKRLEGELNYRWIFMYAWHFGLLDDSDIGKYISESYSLRQAGVIDNNLIYLLFEKGGTFNKSDINGMLSSSIPKNKVYEQTDGEVNLVYLDIE